MTVQFYTKSMEQDEGYYNLIEENKRHYSNYTSPRKIAETITRGKWIEQAVDV
ncbi:MAG: hypothetical protein WA395_04795 [Nitrososphaeraceae archaeon]|jgi:hypothetical protein